MTHLRSDTAPRFCARFVRVRLTAWIVAVAIGGFTLPATATTVPTAAPAEKIVTVEGVQGATLNLAIQQGLVRALEKVHGVAVSSTQGARLRQTELTREVTGLLTKHFERIALGDVSMGRIMKETKGIIASYNVTSQQQDSKTKHWTVALEVVVPVYDPANPRPGSKRTMIVLPFKIADRRFDLGTTRISGTELRRKFLKRSISHFTQSRRFLMLDRTSTSDIERERDLIRADAPLMEKLALGQTLGADLMVTGVLEELSWTSKEHVVQPTGYRTTKNELRYHLSFEVLNTATRRILFADQIQATLNNAELKRLSDKMLDLRSDDLIIELAAQSLAIQILESLYPIKIVKASDREITRPDGTKGRGQVTLNQGGLRVKIGDVFRIHSAGEEMIDPDTGDSLGAEEELVATVVVTDVKPLYSRAVLLSGDVTRIERGAICRRLGDQ